MGERWNDKLAAFRAQLVAMMRPIKVEPKRSRFSGPQTAVVPSDWYDPHKQQFLGPQCRGCHQNVPVGTVLDEGLCAGCKPIPLYPRTRTMGGGDLPPAA